MSIKQSRRPSSRLSYAYDTRTAENKTSFERKLERWNHDPIRFETGRGSAAPTIKGVRLA